MSLTGFVDQSCFAHMCVAAVANLMFCEYLFAYSAHICVLLCLCAAVCGRQFLSRVDILMQFSDVF